MKVLHTSDWHLGQEFYNYDRIEEHKSFLNQIKNIVAEEKPDVLMVCGDIYHNGTPSNATMTLFTEHLLEIANTHKGMKTIITAGNHDSSSRLEITRKLWELADVNVVGKIEKVDDIVNLDRLIIPVNNASNEIIGYIVAMPHVFPQAYPLMTTDTPRDEREKMFWEALNTRLHEINTENLPVVMMAHMAITGSDTIGHDLTRGNMDYEDISNIKVDFDYLALGHIHCPQDIKGANARYCGTPIPVSFDEDYKHSVSIVEVDKGCKPTIRTIEINNPIPIITFPKEAKEFEDVLKELENLKDEKIYLRLNVKLTDVAPTNARERIVQTLKDKQIRFCTIKWEREHQEQTEEIESLNIEEVQQISPIELAKRYYREKFNSEMNDEYVEMLDFAIQEVNKDKNANAES